MRVEYVRHEPPGVPTAFWRGVGPTHNVFVVESFIDDLASRAGKDPVAFASDCREGICGTCHMVINGVPQGPGRGAACQVYMRSFAEGSTITVDAPNCPSAS
mgnify:CR=1 FL=1